MFKVAALGEGSENSRESSSREGRRRYAPKYRGWVYSCSPVSSLHLVPNWTSINMGGREGGRERKDIISPLKKQNSILLKILNPSLSNCLLQNPLFFEKYRF